MYRTGDTILARSSIGQGINVERPGGDLTSLPLDLLARPSRCLLCAMREVFVGAGVTCHGREPIGAEVMAEFAAREGLGDVSANRSAQCMKSRV